MSEIFNDHLAERIAAVKEWRDWLIVQSKRFEKNPPRTRQEVIQFIDGEVSPPPKVFSALTNTDYFPKDEIFDLLGDYDNRVREFPLPALVVDLLDKLASKLSAGIQAAEKDLPSKTLPATVAPAGQLDETKGKPKLKKSTGKKLNVTGDTGTDAKIKAALLNWHKYESGSVLNEDPVGVNKLSELSETSGASVTRFFKRHFEGHTKYKSQCRNRTTLQTALTLMNGDFSPAMLSGNRAKEIASYDHEADMDE